MRKIKEKIYNKLVRDKIPEVIESYGKKCIIHIANNEEYKDRLKNKLIEELNEFIENPNAEEMADMLEVIDGFIKIYDLDKDEVKRVKEEKRIERGEFSKKYILEKVFEDSTTNSAYTIKPTITADKLCVLTFDDGPSETTSLVLDKLEKYKVKASFFIIGQNVTDTTIPVMKRILSLGNEIENHSWTHSDMSQMTESEIKEEIKKTDDVIYNTVGVRTKFFRVPYLLTSDAIFASVDMPIARGIVCNDWESTVSAETRTETILNNTKDRDIIILHDFNGNTNTVDALDSIISGLCKKGFSFVTIRQLFELNGEKFDKEHKI